jgi:GT2 family glycosyltransferase
VKLEVGMTLFSVIIPTCHRNEALMRCLKVLAPENQEGMTLFDENSVEPSREYSGRYEVIVTDDGSPSTAERMLREKFPWAAWTSGPRRGPAANRNHGAAKAAGDWLVFVDDDCVPECTFLAAYARATGAEDCDVLEGMTIPEDVRIAADMECPVNEAGGHLWSCNFAIKRHLFLTLGGFDENFPGPAAEDIDMHTRLSKAGYQAVFVSEARVKHPWRPRRGVDFLQVQAKSLAYYVNNHPEKRKWFTLTSLVKRAVRAVVFDFPTNFVRFRGRGVWRALLLELASLGLLAKYLNRRDPSKSDFRLP